MGPLQLCPTFTLGGLSRRPPTLPPHPTPHNSSAHIILFSTFCFDQYHRPRWRSYLRCRAPRVPAESRRPCDFPTWILRGVYSIQHTTCLRCRPLHRTRNFRKQMNPGCAYRYEIRPGVDRGHCLLLVPTRPPTSLMSTSTLTSGFGIGFRSEDRFI